MRTIYAFVGLILVVCLCSTSATKVFSSPMHIVRLTGSCARLVLGVHDFTDLCATTLVNVDNSGGRNSFTYVSIDEGAFLITFSGNSKLLTHQGQDVAIQPIDAVIVEIVGNVNSLQAGGTCRFANPNTGEASVDCQADTPQGKFIATFITNSRGPTLRSY